MINLLPTNLLLGLFNNLILTINRVEKIQILNFINIKTLFITFLILQLSLIFNMKTIIKIIFFWSVVFKGSFIRNTILNIKDTKPWTSQSLFFLLLKIPRFFIFVLILTINFHNRILQL